MSWGSRIVLGCVLIAGALSFGTTNAGCEERPLPHRWLFVMSALGRPERLERTTALLPRAAAAGYNAIVLSDGVLRTLDQADEASRDSLRRLQDEARRHGLDLIPCVMMVGYGGGILAHDPNLAEGLPVKDAVFIAKAGVATLVPDPPVSLRGGDFEAAEGHHFLDWDSQDDVGESIFADHDVFRSGRTALRMESFKPVEPDAPQSRLWQRVKVHPFRQYHLRVWIKTEDFRAPAEAAAISVQSVAEPVRRLNYADFRIRPTQDWSEYHVVFNSLSYDEVTIYLGTWGAQSGRIWWDDLLLEEVGLLNVLRRPGCPLTVRGEDGTLYEEGRDVEPIRDPNLRPSQIYHEPPVIRLAEGSRIREGERLRVSYYHPVVIYRSQVTCCLSDPKAYEILREEVRQVNEACHPSAFFMQHDEIRVANWDDVCQSRNMTAGQLLADNVRRCIQIIREIRPDAKIWVWSDMFDPMHNMRDRYYIVNGDLAGACDGLTPDIGIVNWANHLQGRNLKWFSDRGHEQVLAGYYDFDSSGSAIEAWLKAGEGIPGITGAMYTTWRRNYDDMEAWAKAAWGTGAE